MLKNDKFDQRDSYCYVHNAPNLLDHGHVELRRDALAILDQVLQEVKPFEWCRQKLSIADDHLTVGN